MIKIKKDFPLILLKRLFGFISYTSCDDGQTYYCICNLFVGEDRIIKQDDGVNCCQDTIDHKYTERELEILLDMCRCNVLDILKED